MTSVEELGVSKMQCLKPEMKSEMKPETNNSFYFMVLGCFLF